MNDISKMPSFYKMTGSGNDFILIDNRDGVLDPAGFKAFVTAVCRRKFSVGADGLILIEPSEKADFRWRFFNQDGSVAEMCGNGGRCAARFAFLNQICGPELSFETDAGIVRAIVDGVRVRLEMTIPSAIVLDEAIEAGGKTFSVDRINTGVPHAVIWVNNLEEVPIVEWGRPIRYHARYAPAGTNVNFVTKSDQEIFLIRTYERGVEDETLACGTGSVAVALIAAHKGLAESPVSVKTRGGEILTIHFNTAGFKFVDVFLEGDARVIYQGRLWNEAVY